MNQENRVRAPTIPNDEKMKIDISYISTRHYDRTNIVQWVFMFKRYTAVRGFIMRIFGCYFNIRENNAIEKLIKLFKESRKRG